MLISLFEKRIVHENNYSIRLLPENRIYIINVVFILSSPLPLAFLPLCCELFRKLIIETHHVHLYNCLKLADATFLSLCWVNYISL